MKKINVYLLATFCATLIACSDDDSSTANNNDAVINALEDAELSATTVSSNITIENATKETGNPPSPTGSLPFTVSETEQSAFLNSGFNITIPQSAAGAYLQIKGNDGTLASEYYDIKNGFSFSPNKHTLLKNNQTTTRKDGDTNEIEVDFGAEITPGQFCYAICIYDTEGNISQPQEVCVEVEAWGGNTAIAGTWNFVKSEYSYAGTSYLDTNIAGVESCNNSNTIVICDNETEIEIENAYCDTTAFLTLVLNADGTYRYDSESTSNNFDYDLSTTNCEATFGTEETSTEYSTGNWAYDEEENKFTLVEFEYFDSSENDGVAEVYEDGYLAFDGSLTLTESTFSLYEESLYQGETETSKIDFKR